VKLEVLTAVLASLTSLVTHNISKKIMPSSLMIKQNWTAWLLKHHVQESLNPQILYASQLWGTISNFRTVDIFI